jgi:hypothetical protein
MAETAEFKAVLAYLKARRARLDQLIVGMEAEMGQPDASVALAADDPGSGGTQPPVSVTIHPDSFFGLSIIEAAKKFLKMARRAQHLNAIADALAQGGLKRPADNVMSGILVRAAKGREVIKVGKGMWGLTEWYPKPPKEPIEDRRKRAAPRKAPSAKKLAAPKKKVARKAPSTLTEAASAPAPKNGARPSDVALEVMRAAAGKPLHAEEITKRINERGVATSRLPIESFLSRQVKAGKMQKVGPSVYALAS